MAAPASTTPSSQQPVDGASAASEQDTKRRIAELEAENEALRADAARLRRLLDSASDHAIVALDLDGRITGWNEGARAILGYGDAEILGRSGEIFFPAEDRAAGAFVAELCRALEEGRAPNERWHIRHDGSRFWASGAMLPLLGPEGEPEGFVNVMRDNTRTRAEEERRALVLAEMGHRVKNVLATAQAVAMQTMQRARVPADTQAALTERLIALSRCHDLLLRGGWEGAPLAEVLQRVLSPYAGSGRTFLDGPPVRLPANAVEPLGLAFHELATNAAKYGALSVPLGQVEVFWGLRKARSGTRLVEITWRERGGPTVVPPTTQGFGSRLLERGLTHDLGGNVRLDFRPEGLECHICLPVTPGLDGG